jgi:magnesium-transporting ATPase (P-type)
MSGETPAWHALGTDEVLDRLASGPDGLTAEEAARRLARHGPNRVETHRPPSAWRRLLAQLDNVLIYVLLGAAAVTAALGEWLDTGVILGVVVINALIGFLQEGKAERALDAIRGMLAPVSVVRRGGRRREVPADQLVPGDVVELKAGDRVPADLRVLDEHGLQAQESALTGESEAVDKDAAPVAPEAHLAERRDMLYAGSLVTYGSGRGVVVATGKATEIGRVSGMLAEVETPTTPLLRQMAVFGRWLTLGILVVAVWAFLFGWLLRGYSVDEMFLATVSLAVAAVPEGLPAIMTITLAIGVTRMARRNAIIRRLPAVETLGSVTVICSDKTGTLTRNELTVRRVVTADAVYAVDGSGHAPDGAIRRDGIPVAPGGAADLDELARAAVLCNEAELIAVDGHWRVAGNPTDGALLTLALKAGHDRAEVQAGRPRRDLIPFDSAHKFMASLHDAEDGALLVVKGAPERVLEMCSRQQRDGADAPLDRAYWEQRIEELAESALRVLAIAARSADAGLRHLRIKEVDGGLVMLGLLGLIDPPRAEARAAIDACRGAGIAVKMITGDHAATARAIGSELGLDGGRVLTGHDLDRLDADALRRAADQVAIFARTTPEHKLRLVEALQAQGEVVAMTGDGVNDAPALKRADVGVAMGRKGTEAAKEAAEMVLADDRFVSIAHAVEEGRKVYDNLVKNVVFVLPTNAAEGFCVLTAILLGQTLPITPVQILWINMVTGVTLGLALAFEAGEDDLMRRPPRRPGAPILSPFVIWRILLVSLLLMAAAYGMFQWALHAGLGLDAARTVAVNALVACEMAYLLTCRRIRASALSREGLFGSRPVLLSIVVVALFQLAFTYLPWLQTLFRTSAISPGIWLGIAGAACLMFATVELEKALRRRYEDG